MCDICREAPAAKRCAECEQVLCEKCTKYHAASAASRNHTVENLDHAKCDMRGTVRYCTNHKTEILRFWCNSCKSPICRDCKLTSHEHHPAVDLSTKVSGARPLLLRFAAKSIENIQPNLNRILKRAETHRKEMLNQKQKFLTEIRNRGDEIKRAVDDCTAEAVKQADTRFDEAMKTSDACMTTMLSNLESLQKLTDHAQGMASFGCDLDALLVPSQIKDYLGLQLQPSAERQGFGFGGTMPHDASNPSLKMFLGSEWKPELQLRQSISDPNEARRRIIQESANYIGQLGRTNEGKKGIFGTVNAYTFSYGSVSVCAPASTNSVQMLPFSDEGESLASLQEYLQKELLALQQDLLTWLQ